MCRSLPTVTPARLLELGLFLINRRVAGAAPARYCVPVRVVFASCLDVASGIEDSSPPAYSPKPAF